MKNYFFSSLLCLTLVACQTEEVGDVKSEAEFSAQSPQDGSLVEVSYMGQTIEVQKNGDQYLLDDMVIDVTEDNMGNKAGMAGNAWTNKTVYYQIDKNLGTRAKNVIYDAIYHFRARTSLKFKEAQSSNYIYFTAIGKACTSVVGMGGGKQILNLGGCLGNFDSAVHEIMHAIGFHHEHQRSDRDNYVKIHWDNTEQDQSFKLLNQVKGLTAFDFKSSVMYAPKAWSNNGKAVITLKNGKEWGARGTKGLSVLDTRGIESRYGTGAPTIAFKGNNGGYVSSEGGKKAIASNRSKIASWEKFELWSLSNGKVALRGSNGKFVSSEDGRTYMTCNRNNYHGAWEQFELIFHANYKFSLRGSNGKYVSSNDGKKPLTCNRSKAGNWEQFTLVDAD